MNRLVCLLIAGVVLSGCATTPENPWNEIEVSVKPAATPVDCGRWPMPYEVIGDSIVYTNAGANDLEAFRACSQSNSGIAAAHAQQIDQLHIATRGLVDAGAAQRRIAAMRQTMLEEERKHFFWQSLGQWVVIIGLGVAL